MIKEGLAQLAAAHSRDKTAFVKNSMSGNTLTGGKGGRMRHPPPPVREWKLPGHDGETG
ncbi:hypothetical protein OAF50_03840 [bacterium]|nr:hypothetical protein [bacterium]